MLANYILSPAIASGGMGSVHLGRAVDRRAARRPVAIKQMHPHLSASTNLHAMFMDEVWLTRHIRHPNIVSFIEALEQEGELFLVMEYIHGESLSRAVTSKQPPLSVASAILCDVLRGLQAAHDACDTNGMKIGAVHRDISPQNILVGADGRARIIDFGVATFSSQLHNTTHGRIRGKLRFLAPEQLLGMPATSKTDLFAFGILAFELFSGTHPLFETNGDELIAAMSAARFPMLHQVVPELPRALSTLIASMLARSPSRRPASAAAVREQLARIIPPANEGDVASWLDSVAHDVLVERSRMLTALEEEADARAAKDPSGDDLTTIAASRAERNRSGKTTIVGVALAAPLIVVAGLVWSMMTKHHSVAQSRTEPSLSLPSPSTGRPSSSSSSSSSVDEVTSTGGTFALASPPSHVAKPPVVAPRHHHPAPQPASTTAATPPSCDPPFTVDEQLHKHYRIECLRPPGGR